MPKGRPTEIPQGDTLVAILNQHPTLTYQQIIDTYQWAVSNTTLRGAARRAGYHKYKPYLKGDGPLSPHQMDHDTFWGKVQQTADEAAEALRSRAERGNSGGLTTLRRATKRVTREHNSAI